MDVNPPSLARVVCCAQVQIAIILALGLLISGCGSQSASPISVTAIPVRAGLAVTQSLTLSVRLTNDKMSQGVTFTTSGGGSFTAVTPTSATYTAPATAGTYMVTATSVADPSKSATFTVGVTDLTAVSTYHNNPSRDGVNSQEYALTTSLVKTSTFGKLFSCAVDGAVYAQPLWVANLNINGTKHNVIFAATQHESVYAFDADANPCTTLWQAKLLDPAHGGTPGETTVPSPWPALNPPNRYIGNGYGDLVPEIGITGTPVIDTSSGTLYVVSKSVIPGATPAFFQRLHALDIISGAEKFSGPVLISASVSGTGDGSVNSVLTFSAQMENQRAGLALVNGVVYIAWAAHEDADPYHGWIIGYNAANLTQVAGAVFNTTPNAIGPVTYSRGGIWMGGGAPAVDANNNLYVTTGNGTFDGVTNFGDSVLKLGTTGGLTVTDWFTPQDQATLDMNDTDLGSGAAVVLLDAPSAPHPHMLIGAGKEGALYLVDRDAMGHYNTSNNNQIVQTVTINDPSFSTPAFWQNRLYYGGAGGTAKAYSFDPAAGNFITVPMSQTTHMFPFPGATPSISAAGTSNGIVWALDNSVYGPPYFSNGAAVLYAYDATNLATELWNSGLAAANRDAAGNAVKFTVPTVANGKVYVGTRTEITVYGLLPN